MCTKAIAEVVPREDDGTGHQGEGVGREVLLFIILPGLLYSTPGTPFLKSLILEIEYDVSIPSNYLHVIFDP